MVTLPRVRQEEIDGEIHNALLNVGMSYPSNDILGIAERLGITVHIVDLSNTQSKRIKGFLDYGDEGMNAKMFIETSLSKQERTFTIAHEIGHFILHKPKIGGRFRVEDFDYKREDTEASEEPEANYFAASILVPKEEFLSLVKKVGDSFESLGLIADYFGVSRSVIQNRVTWLKSN